MDALRRYLRRLAAPFLGGRYSSKKQARWEECWASHRESAWRITEIPDELQEAIALGWFLPGADVLDIGCGRGECAAWLAQQGLTLLGVDFAPSAIAQARTSYGESQQLQFAVLDICRAAPERCFQALFDRGCLHGIPDQDRPAYVRHVAGVALPGAHFLLMHKVLDGTLDGTTPAYQQTADRIRREFQDYFDLVRVRQIVIPRVAGPKSKPPVLALAVWLVRK